MGASQTGLAKDPARCFQHGERCCWRAGKIQLGMGALVKDPGPPKLGTWVSKQPLTIPVSGITDSGLRSGLVTRYGWSGQMTNEPGAVAQTRRQGTSRRRFAGLARGEGRGQRPVQRSAGGNVPGCKRGYATQ